MPEVRYKAVADFSQLIAAVAAARAAIRDLKRDSGALNVGLSRQATDDLRTHTAATSQDAQALREHAKATREHSKATQADHEATSSFNKAQAEAIRRAREYVGASREETRATQAHTRSTDEDTRSVLNNARARTRLIEELARARRARAAAAEAEARTATQQARTDTERARAEASRAASAASAEDVRSRTSARARRDEEDLRQTRARGFREWITYMGRVRQQNDDIYANLRANDERLRHQRETNRRAESDAAARSARDQIRWGVSVLDADRRRAQQNMLFNERLRTAQERNDAFRLRETERLARAETARVRRMGFGRLMINVGADVNREVRRVWADIDDTETRFRRLGLTVRRIFADMIPGRGSSGTHIFDSFVAAGDRVGRMLTKSGRGLLSWRGLIVLLLAAIGPLVSALSSLVAALVGVTNVVMSLAGATAALPGLLLAAGAALGAIVVGVMPVVNAVKAYQKVQQEVNAGARQSAQAQTEAADRVRSASRAYHSASKAVQDALSQERKAQVAVNKARKEALRQLEDLRIEVAKASLNEQEAVIALAQAEDDYKKSLADPTQSLLDRQQAYLRVIEAQYDLQDVQRRNQRNAEDLAEAERKGVEGSDQVVSAKEAVRSASDGVTNAYERQQDASKDLAKAQQEAAAGGASALKAMQAYQDQLDKLSPSTRAFVVGVIGLSGAWNKLQKSVSEHLFAPLVGQLGNVQSLLPTIQLLFEDAAGAIGDFAARGIELVSSGPWKSDFATLSKANTEILTAFGNAILYIATAFKDIAVAAMPFTTWVAQAIERTSAAFSAWAIAGRNAGSITQFLAETSDRISQLWRILRNFGAFLGSMYTASKDFTTWMLDGLERITKGWAEAMERQKVSGSGFRTWLTDMQDVLSSVGYFIAKLSQALASMGADRHNMEEAKRIFVEFSDKVLPPLVEFFTNLAEHEAISDIFTALGTAIEAINEFVTASGGLPFRILIDGLQAIAGFWKWVMGQPALATPLAMAAVAMAAFTTAAAVGKLTGMFAIWNFLRWILGKQFPRAILSRILGSVGLGGLAARVAPTAAAPTDTASGYIIQILNKIETTLAGCCSSIRTMAATVPKQLTEIIAQLTRCCGVMAASGAAGAAGAARSASAARSAAAAASAQRGLPSAMAALPAGATAAAPVARTAQGYSIYAAGPAYTQRPPIYVASTRGAPVVAPGLTGAATSAETAASRWGPRLSKGVGPAALLAMFAGLAADSNMFGGSGSLGKQLAQAGGAVGTGALMGMPLGPWGIAGGAVAGAGYSLYKDKGLRENIGGFMRTPVGAALSMTTGVGAVGVLLSNFTDIFGDRGKAGTVFQQLGRAFDRYVTEPISSFIDWIKDIPGAVGEGIKTLPASVSRFFTDTIPGFFDDLTDSTARFFTDTIPHHMAGLGKTVARFFTTVIPNAIDSFYGYMLDFWTEKVPFAVGAFYGFMVKFWTELVPNAVTPFYKFMWNFWTETAPGALAAFYKYMWSFWTETAPGALAAFYKYMWNFWTQTVPGALAAFYKYMWNFWTESAPGALSAFYTFMWKFWTESAPRAIGGFYSFMWDFWSKSVPRAVGGFYTYMWNFWTRDVPGAVGEGLKTIWNHIKGIGGWFSKGFEWGRSQSGGIVDGVSDGKTDSKAMLLTVGEFVIRKRVTDKPGARRLLEDLNEERIDPEALYGALNAAAQMVNVPTEGVGVRRAPVLNNAVSTTNQTTNNRTSGLSIGNVTINNPVKERSEKSLRRSLQSLAYMTN